MKTPLSALKNTIKKINVDGWVNVLTGLGTKNRDKRLSAQIDFEILREVEAETLYAADAIASKIVDILPDDALRAGYRFTGMEKEQSEKLQKTLNDQFNFSEVIKIAWQKARLYGGSALFLVTADSEDLSIPRVEGSPILGLTVLTRWQLFADTDSIQRDLRKPLFGQPTIYSFQPSINSPNLSQSIHISRLILFPGIPLPRRLEIGNNYWQDSVLNKIQNSLRNYQTMNDGAATIVQDFRVAVFKVRNLADSISSGDDNYVLNRLQIQDMARSICRAVVIDAEDEDFDYKTASVAGLDQLLQSAADRLVAETDIPHTKLLNESPDGSNATGNSTMTHWYDYVSSQQKTYLSVRLIQCVKIILEGQKGNSYPEDLGVEFNPLWQMDEKEQASVRLMQAQADQIYMDSQAVDPREIAISRFGGDKYTTDTIIDLNLRDETQSVIPPEPPENPNEKPPTPPNRK